MSFDIPPATTSMALDALGRYRPSAAYHAPLPNTSSGRTFTRVAVISPGLRLSQRSVSELTFVVGTPPQTPATVSRLFAEHSQASADIENLRLLLGLSVTTFANLFDVSRQAVYKWLAGEPMNQAHTNRLAQLREAAATLTDFAKSDTRALTRRKLPSGRTVVESISAGEDPIAVALVAANLIQKDSEQREALDAFLGNRRTKPQRGTASFVTPHAGEDLEEA
jgi:DNA-binding transcriptional regulator YiaG